MSIAPRDDLLESAEVAEAAETQRGAETVQPDNWASPRGYSNGAVASGKFVTIAGQVGWNPRTCTFDSDDFGAQTRQALHNVVEVLLAAGARPHDLVKELQDFVKARIAPYKYPRSIEFAESLPRTATGKLQRYRLREREQ